MGPGKSMSREGIIACAAETCWAIGLWACRIWCCAAAKLGALNHAGPPRDGFVQVMVECDLISSVWWSPFATGCV